MIHKGSGARKKKRRFLYYFLYFLIISILIHLIFMVWFFNHGFQRRAMSWFQSFARCLTPEKKEKLHEYYKKRREQLAQRLAVASAQDKKNKKKRDLPAQLRAPLSEFGWVLFDDQPVQPPQKQRTPMPEIPTNLDGDVGQSKTVCATESDARTGANVVPKAVPGSGAQAPKPLQKIKQIEQSVPQQKVEAPAKEVTKEVAQKQVEKQAQALPQKKEIAELGEQKAAAVVPEKESVAQRIAKIKQMQEKLQAYQAGEATGQAGAPSGGDQAQGSSGTQAIDAQETDQPVARERVRGARSTTAKGGRNIIALTKGFVEKRYGVGGTDLIDRDGDPDKRPSFEELKYLSYESKINWCLQASWKQNFCYRPMAKPQEGDAVVEFTIDEHGELKTCSLLQSTGHQELDALVMKNMKFASPYPPLPKHFGTKTYTTGRVIQVRLNRYEF